MMQYFIISLALSALAIGMFALGKYTGRKSHLWHIQRLVDQRDEILNLTRKADEQQKKVILLWIEEAEDETWTASAVDERFGFQKQARTFDQIASTVAEAVANSGYLIDLRILPLKKVKRPQNSCFLIPDRGLL